MIHSGSFKPLDKHPLWTGDKVKYNSLHKWVRDNFGHAPNCEDCGIKGSQGKRMWTIEWANKTGEYKRDRLDWIALCRKCHTKKDKDYRISIEKKTVYINKQVYFKSELNLTCK